MSVLKGIRVRLHTLFRRRDAERELDEELRFHLALETEENIRAGLSAEEARRRALVAFGGIEQAKEVYRDQRGARWLEDFVTDVRLALRALRRSPVFAAAAIVTLAIGIGANTAIFSAVNAVILQPLPYPDPEQLVMLWEENAEKNWHQQVVAPANFLDWRERVAGFRDAAAYTNYWGTATLTGAGEPRVLRQVRVTGNLFSVLGVRAQIGRVLEDEETWENGGQVAVVGDRLWREQFAADPRVIGRTVQINGAPVKIVGVMPHNFAFPAEDIDLWRPMEWDKADRTQVYFRRAHWPRAIARLKPGISFAQADAQLQAVAGQLKLEFPETNKHMGAGMTPLHQFLVGDTRLPLLLLLAAVGLLLLIACANVGNLLLVHAAGRGREVALRLALGAGRLRLLRQALAESLVLSALGGLAGLALGWWGTHALVALQPDRMMRVREFELDRRVLGYVLAITATSGLLFGMAPAFWSARRAPSDALREGGRTGSQGRRLRVWGDVLAVGEVALALLLTIGSGLLIRSFWRLTQVDAGFDPRGVLAVSINLPVQGGYDTSEKAVAFFAELVRRAEALPGVSASSATSNIPLLDPGYSTDFVLAGWPPGRYGSEVVHRRIVADYFQTMRVRLLRGQAPVAAERMSSAPALVINEAFARQYFPDRNPVGQRLTFDKFPDTTSVWWTIAGVVSSEHQRTLALDPQIEVYQTLEQDPTTDMTLLVRTEGEPASLATPIRRLVADMDPNLAIASMRTMNQVRSDSLGKERFLTLLLVIFGGIGLLLSLVGVYGVIAQLVQRRVKEMGIRIALGARAAQVQWLILRHGLRLLTAGLAVGLGAAFAATRLMEGLLYHVAPADPITFVGVSGAIILTGLLATWFPALQASRADPALTLRSE